MNYHFAEFTLDEERRQLRRGEEQLHLSPKAFELLQFLAHEHPRALRKQELYDRLWPATYVVEANLAMLIRELRRALGDEAHAIIRTIHRFGYALAARVVQGGSTATTARVAVLVLADREIALHEGENVIGRDEGLEVSLRSSAVSRRHAIITVTSGEATLIDLRSKNGTQVNGSVVSHATTLHDGATICFGRIEAIYRSASSAISTETNREE